MLSCYKTKIRQSVILFQWTQKSFLWLYNFVILSNDAMFCWTCSLPEYYMHEIFDNGHNISQLICYSRAYAQYSDFLDRAQLLTQKLLKQDYVAPRILRLSWSGWLLRNIHLKWQRTFFFLHSFCLSSISNKSFIRLDWVTLWMSYKKQELHTLRKHMGSPPVFLWGSLLLIFLVFCFCVCLRPVSWMPNVVIFSGLSILDVYPFSFI